MKFWYAGEPLVIAHTELNAYARSSVCVCVYVCDTTMVRRQFVREQRLRAHHAWRYGVPDTESG